MLLDSQLKRFRESRHRPEISGIMQIFNEEQTFGICECVDFGKTPLKSLSGLYYACEEAQ